MARYIVAFGHPPSAADPFPTTVKVRARSHQDAFQRVFSDLPTVRTATWVMVARRFRDKQPVLFQGNRWPGDGPGGTAGVREPRRPKPAPPHLSVERDLP